MYQAYAVRPYVSPSPWFFPKLTASRVGNAVLFNDGGYLDRAFYVNHVGAGQFVADFYPTAGAFQANYLSTDLKTRGLINSTFGPELKNFPFYEDAKAVRDVIFELYVHCPATPILTLELDELFHDTKWKEK